MKPGLLIIISSPSGGGKTSLCKALRQWSPQVVYSVTCTTRAPRPGEQHGREYFFLSRQEFEQQLASGYFLEHAQYNGQDYGTPRAFAEEQLCAGRIVLMAIDVQGAAQVTKSVRQGEFAYPDALVKLFLMPTPTLLEQRLRKRGTDTDEIIAQRLAVAETEMAAWHEFDYVILTGHIDDDVAQAKSIIIAEQARVARQPKDHPWPTNALSF